MTTPALCAIRQLEVRVKRIARCLYRWEVEFWNQGDPQKFSESGYSYFRWLAQRRAVAVLRAALKRGRFVTPEEIPDDQKPDWQADSSSD